MHHFRRAALLALAGPALAASVFAQAPSTRAAPASPHRSLYRSPRTSRLKVCRRSRPHGGHAGAVRVVEAGDPARVAPARSFNSHHDVFGTVQQIHSVAGPGMDRQQLTFFREGRHRQLAAPGTSRTARTSCSARTPAAAPKRSSCFASILLRSNRRAPDRRQVPQRRPGLVASFRAHRLRLDSSRRARRLPIATSTS